MKEKYFTVSELLAAMDGVHKDGADYADLKLICPTELKGRDGALAGLANRLGIDDEWVEYEPDAPAIAPARDGYGADRAEGEER